MTRNQHWLSRFYLKHFANPSGRLHVYRQESNSYFQAPPEKICGTRDLYEVRQSKEVDATESFLAQNLIEKMLSEFESQLVPTYERLITCCKTGDFNGPEFQNGIRAICAFAANTIVRHPISIEPERTNATKLASVLKKELNLSDEEISMLKSAGWKEDYDALSELATLAVLLFSADEAVSINRIYNSFLNKSICILEAPLGMKFISTSLPIFIIGQDDNSYEFDYAYIPLSDTYAVLFTTNHAAPNHIKLDWTGLMRQNRLLLLNCLDWSVAFSSVEGSLRRGIQDWKFSLEYNKSHSSTSLF